MLALYRIEFLKRKWWFPFYFWYLSACTVIAWRLRMKVTGEKESCLDFLRELVVHIFTRHRVGPAHIEAIPLTGNLEKEVRFDGSNYWITEPDDQGKEVRKNCKQCFLLGKRNIKASFKCEKCGVALNALCFKDNFKNCCYFISFHIPDFYQYFRLDITLAV
jgi:hypothetical protein